ncbi:hypothetical protein TI39_contig291g00009 [Zymoseptoria brevis]|uniref:Uncharacterized protein n=1 Tax=Zymoseptoria brevis TaxID=1047168 RepID=A0A0F4GVN1_9PEZI|nr:hypothetical protein TI39_contig291g00009 [Zymoseptoria brevis]
MSLCFDQAYTALRNGRISYEQYLHEVLLNFTEARDPRDALSKRSWEFSINDPVGNSIREAGLSTPTISHQDLQTHILPVYLSTLHSSLPSLRHHLSHPMAQHKPILRSLLTLAASVSSAQILHYLLSAYPTLSLQETNASLALSYTRRTAPLLDVLYNHDWRSIRNSATEFQRATEWALHTHAEELDWFLAHGGIVNQEILARTMGCETKIVADCVALLLARFGVGMFRGTGVLHMAARRGQAEVVRMLIEAGVHVDEVVQLERYREGSMALGEAARGGHVEIARMLVAYGAGMKGSGGRLANARL